MLLSILRGININMRARVRYKTLEKPYNIFNYRLTVQKSKRSDAQNRLYWYWVDILAKEVGYAKNEMHLVLADKFLPKIEFTTKGGKQISQIPSTRELNIEEFIDYICEIEMFSGEWGIKLPHNQDYKIAVYNEYTSA